MRSTMLSGHRRGLRAGLCALSCRDTTRRLHGVYPALSIAHWLLPGRSGSLFSRDYQVLLPAGVFLLRSGC
jgi:hypothetical protein